jgi:hypothetical protein
VIYAIKKACVRASSEDRVLLIGPDKNEACVEAVENECESGAFIWTEFVVEKEMIRNSVLVGRVVGLKNFVGAVVLTLYLSRHVNIRMDILGKPRRINQVSLE